MPNLDCAVPPQFILMQTRMVKVDLLMEYLKFTGRPSSLCRPELPRASASAHGSSRDPELITSGSSESLLLCCDGFQPEELASRDRFWSESGL